MLVDRRQQRGASLVELMIAMALGIGALSAIASVIGYGIGTNGKMLANSRLHEEINAVASLMTRDIKRAGYNADTVDMVTDPTAAPSAFANSVIVSRHPGEEPDSCITFAYDINGNGVLDTVGSNENFGYRLHDGAVEIRMGGANCDQGGWQNLTDSETVTITDLNFNLIQTTYNSVVTTQVEMFLAGELVSNNAFSRQYSIRFLVRNYD